MTEELKKCPSCGKVIYANADVCKYCGAEQKKPKKKHRILKTILTVFAVLLIVGAVGSIFGGGNDGNSSQSDASQQPSGGASGADKSEKPSGPESESWEITYQNSIIYKNSIGDIACYAIVEVENTGNVDLYLKDASFDFEDESGKLLATYSSMISADPEIVAPGEKGYFYCNMATIKGDITENTEYVFKPALKIEKSKNSIIRYNISDLSISEGDFLSPFNIIGRIENNTDEDAGLVWIACIIYRDDGTPIAACGTNVTDLAAGQKTSFDLSASHLMNLDIKLSDIASYEVYACKTQYQF